MNAIVEYKWIILIGLEVLAWLSTFFMLYARYGLKSDMWFKIGVFLFTITGVIPQIIMGVINFAVNRELDLFTLIIVLVIIYGFTLGKKEVKKLDQWAKRKFAGGE